jgi:predicted nucleic acid-binding protein
MNGVKYLLDTNYILGLVKGQPEVVADITIKGVHWELYGFSSVSRIEALGFPAITHEEERVISALLNLLIYYPITIDIEIATIQLRRQNKLKLPDAIILATALTYSLELLTLDKDVNKYKKII